VEQEIRNEIVQFIEKIANNSNNGIMEMIAMIGISRSKYYDWKARSGIENRHNGQMPKQHWLTPDERRAIIDYAIQHVAENGYYIRDGYRRITYSGIDEGVFAVSPSTVYRVLSQEGLLNQWIGRKTTGKGTGFHQPDAPHKHWHTDIKYVNYRGTFLFFISVMDGYSRYIVHHELRESMTETDVEITIERAREKYPDKKARIISDNGSQYISKDFRNYINMIGLEHVRTSHAYPQSNGKIERFHRSLQEECVSRKSMINIEDAKKQIAGYVDHYNNKRLHSALLYLRPVDFLTGNVDELIKIREEKLRAAAEKRLEYWNSKKKVV
jgi:transposase InsO family protein